MAFRNIIVTSPSKITVKNEQLVIENDEKHQVSLEDISSVMLESQQCTITTFALSEIAEHGICLFTCDEKHIPNAVFSPFNSYCRELETLKAQISMSKPFQKRLWQTITKQKIRNQAKCLKLCGRQNSEKLEMLSEKVRSGDPENIEGIAAAIYFRSLFGERFSRSQDIPENAALNYGYAILRGCIARNIAISGFQPSLGIHHCSELNNFNLADDLIEPFRPIVDLFVSTQDFDDEMFNREIKYGLFNLLNCDMLYDGKRYTVSYTIEKVIQNFSACCKKEREELLLPEIITLEQHNYD